MLMTFVPRALKLGTALASGFFGAFFGAFCDGEPVFFGAFCTCELILDRLMTCVPRDLRLGVALVSGSDVPPACCFMLGLLSRGAMVVAV